VVLHGIIRVFNTILYENEFQNPQIFQQTISLFLEYSTLASRNFTQLYATLPVLKLAVKRMGITWIAHQDRSIVRHSRVPSFVILRPKCFPGLHFGL
jgi:hypothetical protein